MPGPQTYLAHLWHVDRRALPLGHPLRDPYQELESRPKGEFGRIHQCIVHPTKGKGKWVIVTIETHKASDDTGTPSHSLLEMWDIESTTLVKSFTSRTVVSAPDADEEPKGSAWTRRRFWDLGHPERSVILSGIETEGD